MSAIWNKSTLSDTSVLVCILTTVAPLCSSALASGSATKNPLPTITINFPLTSISCESSIFITPNDVAGSTLYSP